MSAVPQESALLRPRLSRRALAFAPGLLAIQERPPAPLARVIVWALCTLVGLMIAWACIGRLDIVASAPGRLIPGSYVKVVQPSEPGIVREILVREGDAVVPGQVLLRMDRQDADADATTTADALKVRELQVRRIDAELSDRPLARAVGDADEDFREVRAQFDGHRQAYNAAVAQASEALERARHEQSAGEQTLARLRLTDPIYEGQASTWADLGKDGYVPRTQVEDKRREAIENAQELKSQAARVDGLAAGVREAQRQLDELRAKARADLENERVEAVADRAKLQQELAKQTHRQGLLELRATEAGVVKDLATHTIGSVVPAGTVLLSIVPRDAPVVAEVTVRNEDVGFVRAGQGVKVKVASYAFQKYGLLSGKVRQVWPDAVEAATAGNGGTAAAGSRADAPDGMAPGFKALVDLDRQSLAAPGGALPLISGMQVAVEIDQGRQTVMQYLLSPIMKVAQESAHER